jgi:hypothetical protein
MNPQAYMSQLASKLNSTDGRGLLMKGVQPQKTHQANPSPAKALPAKPAPAANPAVTPVKPATTTTPGIVGTVQPASAAGPIVAPVVRAPTVTGNPSSPAPDLGPIVQKLPPPAPKAEPVAPVSTMAVWNGLSADNRAAQRVMEQLEASRAAKMQAASQATQSVAAADKPAAQTASAKPAVGEVSPLNQTLMSAQPGLTLWTKPTPANLVEKVVLEGLAAIGDPNMAKIDPSTPAERKPWSLGADLDKYRAHAVKEGTRDSGQSLKKALERTGMTIGDGVNVFILGYGSDKAKPFRVNDGKGLLDEPGKVPQRAGDTMVSFADGVYSLADLITLDALPDPLKDAYKDNNPLVRPLVFTGRTIGGVFKTTEEIGNAVTWGYFDNVTGCIGIVVEDILELFKHVGQAATNLVRAPVQLIAGKKEGTERAMDWVLLVPLEFVTNSVQMKGIANMDDYKNAFEDKGVIGSVLEFGGSTFLVYRAIDELLDELKDKDRSRRTASETPAEPPAEPLPITPGATTGSEIMWLLEGDWTPSTTPGVIYFEGQWPTVTVLIE